MPGNDEPRADHSELCVQQPQGVAEDIGEKDMEIDYEATSDEEETMVEATHKQSRRRNGSDWAS